MEALTKFGHGALQIVSQLIFGKDEKIDDEIVELCYDKYFRRSRADFYHAVCKTVEEINKRQGFTQFKIPSTASLKRAFYKHHRGKDILTKDEFKRILNDIIHESGITGFGAKDTFLYLFGVPATALFIKQRIKPQSISNDKFIPGVTSATVFVLAQFNKI